MSLCPYIQDSGGGYFCDWDEIYYNTHAQCYEASTITVFDTPIHVTKSEVVAMGGFYGILLTVLIMWAWFKSIL